jgi:ribonuclease HI
MTDPDASLVIAAEERLLDPRVRADPDAVDELLDEDFSEIGQSGTHWTREAIIVALAADPQITGGSLQEPLVRRIDVDLLLLTYLYGGVRRSSLWRITPDGPRILFHQGTPILGEDA